MAGLRCFVALPLPECLLTPLVEACEAIRMTDRAWRDQKWVKPENIHVTVKFLGSVPEEDIDALAASLTDSFASAQAFELPFAGLLPMPTRRRATMIWASFLDPDGHAAALAAAAERAALPFGVPVDERAFKPHATLVRARARRTLHEDAILAAQDVLSHAPKNVSVRRVTFLSSELTRTSPVYRELAEWKLAGA
ncbi:MAG: RNA 2',3'-cyclic phosphodiesterase [Coriobacteriales bacterium]|nr:RNA 2',3'-cyclic phosphodiesterase [Coriobacteriales bacterium]